MTRVVANICLTAFFVTLTSFINPLQGSDNKVVTWQELIESKCTDKKEVLLEVMASETNEDSAYSGNLYSEIVRAKISCKPRMLSDIRGKNPDKSYVLTFMIAGDEIPFYLDQEILQAEIIVDELFNLSSMDIDIMNPSEQSYTQNYFEFRVVEKHEKEVLIEGILKIDFGGATGEEFKIDNSSDSTVLTSSGYGSQNNYRLPFERLKLSFML